MSTIGKILWQDLTVENAEEIKDALLEVRVPGRSELVDNKKEISEELKELVKKFIELDDDLNEKEPTVYAFTVGFIGSL